jgi:enoyl-CoA hydratase/carnithine racemase
LEKTKKAIWNSKEVGMSEALEYAWGLISEQNIHPDFEEGSKAFIEKRNPNWAPLK